MRSAELIANVEVVTGELRKDQRAKVLAYARKHGYSLILEALEEARRWPKNWVVFISIVDRKITEREENSEGRSEY